MNSPGNVDTRMVAAVAGLACLMTLVLLGLMSRLVYGDFDLAFSEQLPLTVSGDAGCLLGLAVLAICSRVRSMPSAVVGFGVAAMLAGFALASLLKVGVMGGPAALSLVIGDGAAAFFATGLAFCWWHVYQPMGTDRAVRLMACALAIGVVLFLVANAVPAEFGRVAVPVVLAAAMGLCFVPFLSSFGEGAWGHPSTDSSGSSGSPAVLGFAPMPPVVVATLALAFFSVDFVLDLFPLSLYFEDVAYGSAPTPAAFCSALLLLFAGALYAMGRSGRVSLAFIYTTGFLLTALGYLLTPYRMQGGFPLGAAEAGRIIVFVFAVVVALRLVASSDGAGRSTRAFVAFGVIMVSAMLLADAAVVALSLQDDFDYSDFMFRTLFASCGIAVLVVLLIGPLPRLRERIERAQGNAGDAVSPDPRASLHERCDRFAAHFGLTARETDVLQLIAAGRDVPYIEGELVLAKSTVKTHIKHIYEKCGVSSRQDLLDLIQNFEA